jgi:hypothetical protein
MTINRKFNKDEIVEKMNREICSITLEEYQKIEKEVQPEIEDTKRRIARMKRGEYF